MCLSALLFYGVSVNKIPPTPFTKGGLYMGFLIGKRLSPPFSKGGPRPARHRSRSGEVGGGILLRGRLPEDHRSMLTLQVKKRDLAQLGLPLHDRGRW